MSVGDVIDNAIGVLAPSWGRARKEQRHLARAIDAIDFWRGRVKAQTAPIGPKGEARQSRKDLLNTARDLDRNNAFVSGVIDTVTNNVVGTGIRLEANLQSTRGNSRENVNREIETVWNEWARGVDSSGRLSFWETLRVIERELNVAGEVLLTFSEATDKRRVPLAVDVIEPERLSDDDGTTAKGVGQGNVVVQGVELSPRGVPVAYHLWSENPDDAEYTPTMSRVPADQVLHLFHRKRAGEVRGITRLRPVAKCIAALNQYLDYELTKARIAAAFAMMIKRGRGRSGFTLPSNGTAADTSDAAGNEVGYVAPGMLLSGGPEDSIDTGGSSITSTAFEPFVMLILRQFAAGMNVSYELVSKDVSNTNYSSMRGGKLEDRREFASRQRYLIAHCCQPIYEEFARFAVMNGIRPFGAISSARERSHEYISWIPSGWEWVDPQKEMSSTLLAIKTGLMSAQEAAQKHGQDWRKNVEGIGQMREAFEAAGLEPPAELFQAETPEPVAAPAKPDDKEEDDDEEAAKSAA